MIESDNMGNLNGNHFVAMASAVTSAFGDPTRRDIYLYVRSQTKTTAGDVAEKFDLHPNVARHHLDKLAAGGHLETFIERPAESTPGRPSKHYRALLPKDGPDPLSGSRNDLLIMLLCKALGTMEPEAATALAEEVGDAYGRSLATRISAGETSRSLRSALGAAAEALTAQGFAARVETTGESLSIIANQCPFGDAALSNPILCALEHGLVKGMLSSLSDKGQSRILTRSSRARGDAVCCTSI